MGTIKKNAKTPGDQADRPANTARDIYGTDRRRRHTAPVPWGERLEELNQPFTDAVRRRRRATFFLVLIVVAVFGGTLFVAIQQYLLLSHRTIGTWDARFASPDKAPRSSLDLDTDLQAQFVLDELAEQAPTAIPASGNMPFNTEWVKQAGYYLAQADKSAKNERYPEAIAHYDKVLLIFPNIQGVHRQVGLIHLRQKEYDKAAKSLERSATEEEMTFGLANNLGVAYLALEDFKQAEKNFLVASTLNPDYPLAFFNLATLYLRTGELEKAEQFFQKYLKLKPEDLSAAQTYAMVLVQLKQWDKSIMLLKSISQAAPDVAPIHFRLAEALSHTGDLVGAVETLTRATSLVDPRKALAWMSRPEFDLLRNDPGFQKLLSELGASE